MKDINSIIKSFNKPLNILHLSLFISQMFFVVVAFYIVRIHGAFIKDFKTSQIVGYSTILLCLLIIPINSFVFSKKVKKIKIEEGIIEKLSKYRLAYLSKIIIFQTASIFATISYIITANKQNLIISAIVIIFFLMNNPSVSIIRHDLELQDNQ